MIGPLAVVGTLIAFVLLVALLIGSSRQDPKMAFLLALIGRLSCAAGEETLASGCEEDGGDSNEKDSPSHLFDFFA